MTHLNPDELIDAIEGLLAENRQGHLDACDHCRRERAQLSSVLADAKQVSVPEPSAFFWQHFSERVRTAVDADAAPGHNWPSWLRWQVLAPAGALALLVLGLMIGVPKHDPLEDQSASLAPETLPAPATPDSWAAVVDLVGEFDVETASAAGVIEPGVAEMAVLELTADEQLELTRLLRTELARAKS